MSLTTKTAQEAMFDEYIKLRRELVETSLSNFLPESEPDLLYRSMRYSVLSGGKRLRALLCLAAAETIEQVNNKSTFDAKEPDSKTIDAVMPLACAIEMVHAMSLVHDDLPCLDNDDLRRGKPTNHRIFGDAVALLAGDALLMHAVETIIEHTPTYIDSKLTLDVVKRLAYATGSKGMVGGQVFDLIYTGEFSLPENLTDQELNNAIENNTPISESTQKNKNEKAITPDTVKKIHSCKTGALIEYSLYAGARLMNAKENQLVGIQKFGQILGLAFQITDDLLDVTGNVETLGKTPGKDQASDKATWIKVFGIDEAKEKLIELKCSGEEILTNYHLQNEMHPILSSLLDFAINRKN